MDSASPGFGSSFERIFVSLLAIVTGILLAYLAILGPLYMNIIQYKTHITVNNQLIGQDIINLVVMCPILIIGGICLLLRKQIAKYLLAASPLFLFYYALSYSIGWEWSSAVYTGNSEKFAFHFIYIIIAGLILLLYSLSLFPGKVSSHFKKAGLIVYSVLFPLFLMIFASMWIKGIIEVMQTGTSNGYAEAPTAFWLVRAVDLGFCIPLGFISVYLLWTRRETSFPIQNLLYGFFLTQILAVNAMGWVMFFKHDPTFQFPQLIVFGILAVILFVGYGFIMRGYKGIKN